MLGRLKGKFLEMPICFSGMGIFRVWTETVYANGTVVFPTQESPWTGFTAFNIMAAVVLLVMVAASHRIAPLYGKRFFTPLTAGCLILSACFNFYSITNPSVSNLLGLPAAVLGAVGIGLIILLWSELYGCLNPLRVGLYYSGGIVIGSLILWLFKGLALPWLWVCTCLIPIISLIFLRRSYSLLPNDERPHAAWGKFSFPWKPIAVVALFSFAYGLWVNALSGFFGIHSGLGAVFAAIVIYAGICLQRGSFRFSLVYKLALLFTLLSLMPYGSFVLFGDDVSGFCALASYTFCLIAIMVILSNLTYRYGVNAVWLFGIERAVRLLSVQGGIALRNFSDVFMPDHFIDLAFSVAIAVSVIIATLLLLSEKQLSSPWGAVLKSISVDDSSAFLERNRLGMKCHELGERHGLTQREKEILLLLAQHKKLADIESELFVATSTVKTHIKHIYQKLEIHSRSEMYGLLGIAEK